MPPPYAEGSAGFHYAVYATPMPLIGLPATIDICRHHYAPLFTPYAIAHWFAAAAVYAITPTLRH